MATKVIKLQDNNNNTLIPVTDASVVQMSVDGQVKSVKDVILENEEVTAAGYNDLNDRVKTIEEAPGLDTVGTITDVKINNSTVVSNGVANISKASNNILGVVALGYTDANKGYALKVNSDGKGYVNVPWTDTATTLSGHYSPTGTATNATYVNGNLTQSTGSVSLSHGSSLVVTGLKYNVDSKGHVTDISYSLGKLPADSDTHLTSYNIVGGSTGMVNSAQLANGNVYLRHIEGKDNSFSATSSHKISGSSNIKVTSNSSGDIIIEHTNNQLSTVPSSPTLLKIQYDSFGHIIGDEQVSTGIKCNVLKTNASDLNIAWLSGSIGASSEVISLVENA